MNAMLILSLGATYPGPPNTRRGTIENAAAAAVCPKNCRRETCPPKLRDNRSGFCIFPPRAHKLLRDIQCGNVALHLLPTWAAKDQVVGRALTGYTQKLLFWMPIS